MKLKLGSRLGSIREERKLSQEAMATLLAMSTSSYSRLERGETTISFEELPRLASALGLGVQDLLPDTLSIHNNNNTNQSGLIFGNIYNYYDNNEHAKQLEAKVKLLEEELRRLTSG